VERFVARVEDEKIARAEKRRRGCVGSERVLHGFASRLVWLTSQRSEEDVFRRRGRQEEGLEEEEEVKISVYVHCVVTF
jgi:hypothetical protein